MLKLAKALPALLLLTCALCVSEARADTFVVTGGSATAQLSGGSFNFNGSGMNVSGGFVNGPFTSFFQPGQTVNLLTRNSGSDIRQGPASVNGVAYSQIFYGGTIDLNLVIPALDWREGAFSIVVPFNLTGTLRGCTTNAEIIGPCPGGLVFDTLLSGQGFATINLIGLSFGIQSFNVSGVTYNFGDPVPEPATIVLLSTGLAGAAAAARRRRQKAGR
jgi:hypothetical protein